MGQTASKPAPGTLTRDGVPTALVARVLSTLPSPNTRRAYAKAIADLYAFAGAAAEVPGELEPMTLSLLLDWRASMAGRLSTATINLRIAAVRKFIREARRANFLTVEEAWDLMQIDGLPYRGTRIGNWLTTEQTRRILAVPDRRGVGPGKEPPLRGLRNYCILAILAGCALRVGDLAHLGVEQMQERDGRWVFADLLGKGGRVRTVAIPGWVKAAIDAWLAASGIRAGKLIRQLSRVPAATRGVDASPETGLSTQGLWDVVRKAAQSIGVRRFGPHDLRRTCAKLCRDRGGDIEQIQFMLGHSSVVTTQRYLGSTQNLKQAVNDDLGL